MNLMLGLVALFCYVALITLQSVSLVYAPLTLVIFVTYFGLYWPGVSAVIVVAGLGLLYDCSLGSTLGIGIVAAVTNYTIIYLFSRQFMLSSGIIRPVIVFFSAILFLIISFLLELVFGLSSNQVQIIGALSLSFRTAVWAFFVFSLLDRYFINRRRDY